MLHYLLSLQNLQTELGIEECDDLIERGEDFLKKVALLDMTAEQMIGVLGGMESVVNDMNPENESEEVLLVDVFDQQCRQIQRSEVK